eukprot:TRINITY_DN4293_c0_g1_i1.p1 TRINITY_DN4293_c0_g1~~TRINITY_DN4293_c0_g1_i1.p1  ORF type:complete len:309 (+),score=107.64 TRINITY_DN4293_c0_g1_i1:67-993(+)
MMMDDGFAAPVAPRVEVDGADTVTVYPNAPECGEGSSFSPFALAEAQLFNFDFPNGAPTPTFLKEMSEMPPGLFGGDFQLNSPRFINAHFPIPKIDGGAVLSDPKPSSSSSSSIAAPAPLAPSHSQTTITVKPPTTKRPQINFDWSLDEPSSPETTSDSKKSKLDSQGNETFPSDEKKTVGKARRLAKNRESARRFRQRQRDHINNLEAQAEQLTSSNADIASKLQMLSSENKILTEQLAHLRTFLKREVTMWPGAVVPGAPIPANILNPSAVVGAPGGPIITTPEGLHTALQLSNGPSISINITPGK